MHKKNTSFHNILFCLFLLISQSASSSSLTAYYDQYDFLMGISQIPNVGSKQTISFDNNTIQTGTSLPSITPGSQFTNCPSCIFGDANTGIGFTYNFDPVANPDGTITANPELTVVNNDYNSSNAFLQYLGINDPGNYNMLIGGGSSGGLKGDSIGFDITRKINAFGMFIITSDPLQANDIWLTINGSTIGNSATQDTSIGWNTNDGYLYYLGAISTSSFIQATLSFNPDTPYGTFLYNIGDITTAVPEPNSIFLLIIGFCGIKLISVVNRLRLGFYITAYRY